MHVRDGWYGRDDGETDRGPCDPQRLRKEYRDVVDTLGRTQNNITGALKSYKSAVNAMEQQVRKDKGTLFRRFLLTLQGLT